AKDLGLGKALEILFANATLSLTKDAYTQNWTSMAQNARVIPFAGRFSYNPTTLWWGYGSALLTALAAAMAGWGAMSGGDLPSEETNLGRILVTTGDENFDLLRNKRDGVDDMIICYERVQEGNCQMMAFTMKKEERALRKRTLDTEEIGLLERTWFT
ncbi:hypothetical protein FRC11_008169, partial [Ceratobasidium sp. 423]